MKEIKYFVLDGIEWKAGYMSIQPRPTIPITSNYPVTQKSGEETILYVGTVKSDVQGVFPTMDQFSRACEHATKLFSNGEEYQMTARMMKDKSNDQNWGDLIESVLFYITAIAALGATIMFFAVSVLL